MPVATGANIDFMCCGWLETFESLVISDSHVGQVADINYSYTFEGIQAFIWGGMVGSINLIELIMVCRHSSAYN